MYKNCVVILLGLVVSGPAHVAEVLVAEAHHDSGRFTAHAQVLIKATHEQVHEILTDYTALPSVNPGIKKVEMLATQSDSVDARMRVYTSICMLRFCLDYSWIQDVTVRDDGRAVSTRVDGASSDFSEGTATWQFEPHGEHHTRLIFDGVVKPRFWFPVFLGAWLIKRKLVQESVETAVGVERIVNRRSER